MTVHFLWKVTMAIASRTKFILGNLIGISLACAMGSAVAQSGAPVDKIRTELLRGEAHATASPALKDGMLAPRMLTSGEIEALLSGNTLRRNDRLAIYFAPGGTGTGWGTDWVVDTSARCPTTDAIGDAYDRRDGTCRWRKSIYTASHTWWTDKDKLCQKWAEGGVEKQECWLIGVLFDRVLLFKDTSHGLEGLPMDLRAGKALAQASD